jgi:hypothetical protein
LADVDKSTNRIERFCLTAGIDAMERMLRDDALQLTGTPHSRRGGRLGHRWGTTGGKLGFHGGKVAVHRPRVRSYAGEELQLPTTAAQAEEWLGRWAMNISRSHGRLPAIARVMSSCPTTPYHLLERSVDRQTGGIRLFVGTRSTDARPEGLSCRCGISRGRCRRTTHRHSTL